MEKRILKIGLSFAMEFGGHWLEPIQSRLAKRFPDLRLHELDEYNSICKSAMECGNKLVYSLLEKGGGEIKYEEWETTALHSYPWVNKKNLERLFSQGMYYAMK